MTGAYTLLTIRCARTMLPSMTIVPTMRKYRNRANQDGSDIGLGTRLASMHGSQMPRVSSSHATIMSAARRRRAAMKAIANGGPLKMTGEAQPFEHSSQGDTMSRSINTHAA